MSELEIVKCLCCAYGIDLNEALVLTGLKCSSINPKDDKRENLLDEINKEIKPFDGIIKDGCCKAVVYNHGLYTQCTNKTNREFCSSQCKRLKYGHINHRKNYPVGTYVLENGKREISYQKVKKRLTKKNTIQNNQDRIFIEDSDDEDGTVNEVTISKNPRGRPKMTSKEIEINVDSREKDAGCSDDDNIEEVNVRREIIDDKEYLVSEDNIVFDSKTYKMVGRLLLGKIIKRI